MAIYLSTKTYSELCAAFFLVTPKLSIYTKMFFFPFTSLGLVGVVVVSLYPKWTTHARTNNYETPK